MKENDIRPQDLMKLKEPALKHDIDYMKSRIPEFKISPCPCCQSSEVTRWDEKNDFTYDECLRCSTIYMNPRPDESILEDFYKQSKNYEFWAKYIFPASDDVRRERIFKPRAEKLKAYWDKYNSGEGNRFLEIGAAYGTFCEAVRSLGVFKEIMAVEPTPELAKRCREKGFKTFEDTVEKLDLPKDSVDIVACFEVIEHLASPKVFIEQITGYLAPGGLFICSCPNGKSVGMLEFGALAREVDHEHINYFNPSSLSFLFKNAGLEVLEVSTPGLLDVDIMSNLFKELTDAQRACVGGFTKQILTQGNKETKDEFQRFVASINFSGHMWIVGKK